MQTLDWIVIVTFVCVPLLCALVAAEILAHRDRRRWRDTPPASRPGYLNPRCRW
jgi:hypothetical protein